MTTTCMIRFVGKAKDLKKFLDELVTKWRQLKEEEKNNE